MFQKNEDFHHFVSKDAGIQKKQDSDCFTPLAFRVSGDPDAFTGVTQDGIQVDMPKRTGRSNHVSEVMTLGLRLRQTL